MPFSPKASATFSDDCQTMTIADVTVFSDGVVRETISERNLIVRDNCGNIISKGSTAAAACIQLTNTPNFIPINVGDFYSITYKGITYTYTVQLSDIVAASLDVSANDALQQTATNVLKNLFLLVQAGVRCDEDVCFSWGSGGLSPVPFTLTKTFSFALPPSTPLSTAVTAETVLSGNSFAVSTTFRTGQTTLLAALTEIANSISSQTPLAAYAQYDGVNTQLLLFNKNLMETWDGVTKITLASSQVVTASVNTVTPNSTPCGDCCISVISQNPGQPLPPIVLNSTDLQAASDYTNTFRLVPAVFYVPNFNWKRKYDYSLNISGAAQTLGVYYIPAGETKPNFTEGNFLTTPITVPAAPLATQGAQLAIALNGLNIGTWSYTPTPGQETTQGTLSLVTTRNIKGPIRLFGTPTTAVSDATKYIPSYNITSLYNAAIDASMDIPVSNDGVYCMNLSYQNQTPQYAYASQQLGGTPATYTRFDTTITVGTFATYQVVSQNTGGTTASATEAAARINYILQKLYGISPLQMYAASNGSTIFVYASTSWLNGVTTPSSNCNYAGVTLAVGATSGSVTPGGNAAFTSCLPPAITNYINSGCVINLCRSEAFLAQLLAVEVGQANMGNLCMPRSNHLRMLIESAKSYICANDLQKARSIVQDIQRITSVPIAYFA